MIIMLFKEINKRDFDKLALKMFSILSSNMEIINSKETISDDDFSIFMKKFSLYLRTGTLWQDIFNIHLLVIIL